jgi:hypothetical protein
MGLLSLAPAPPLNGAADVLQDGTLGLIRAADLYDASRGTRFSTYALPWLRVSSLRSPTRFMPGTAGVRLPREYMSIASRLRARPAGGALGGGGLGRAAAEMGVSRKRLVTVLHATRPAVALDAARWENQPLGLVLPAECGGAEGGGVEEGRIKEEIDRMGPVATYICLARLGMEPFGEPRSFKRIAADLEKVRTGEGAKYTQARVKALFKGSLGGLMEEAGEEQGVAARVSRYY